MARVVDKWGLERVLGLEEVWDLIEAGGRDRNREKTAKAHG